MIFFSMKESNNLHIFRKITQRGTILSKDHGSGANLPRKSVMIVVPICHASGPVFSYFLLNKAKNFQITVIHVYKFLCKINLIPWWVLGCAPPKGPPPLENKCAPLVVVLTLSAYMGKKSYICVWLFRSVANWHFFHFLVANWHRAPRTTRRYHSLSLYRDTIFTPSICRTKYKLWYDMIVIPK